MNACCVLFLVSLLSPILLANDGPEVSISARGKLLEASKAQKMLRQQLIDGFSCNCQTRSRIEAANKSVKNLTSMQAYVFSYPCMAEEVSSYIADNVPKHNGRTTSVSNLYAFEIEKVSPQSSYIVKKMMVNDPKSMILGGARRTQ